MAATLRGRVLGVTVATWCFGVAILEARRIWRVLSGPPDLEEYVNRLDFQLIASAFLVITKWLPMLCGVLILEVIILWCVAVARRRAGLE